MGHLNLVKGSPHNCKLPVFDQPFPKYGLSAYRVENRPSESRSLSTIHHDRINISPLDGTAVSLRLL